MSEDRDINDVFDSILLSEDKIIREAFEEGFNKGRLDGGVDGYHAGYHRGAEIGAEIGFYRGVADAFSKYESLEKNVKITSTLRKLRESLELFPKRNDYEINMQSEMDNIRALYKKLCSITKLNLPYPTFSNMSF